MSFSDRRLEAGGCLLLVVLGVLMLPWRSLLRCCGVRAVLALLAGPFWGAE